MKVLNIRLYENREDVTLTTYIHESNSQIFRSKRPGVIICPGGGYLKCATQEAEPVALRFAAMGYHAFVLRYSVYFKQEEVTNLPESSEKLVLREHSLFPNPMLDIAKAFLILNENSYEWGLDSANISICGFSAGAHNVALYSSFWNSSWFFNIFNRDLDVFKPKTIILGYMVGDFYFKYINEIESDKEIFFRASYNAIAGKQELEKEDIEKLSPTFYINESNPPTFLWGTYEDELVSIRNTITYAEALAKKGVPFELHIFEKGKHGLSLASRASAKTDEQIDDNAAKWIELAEKWLSKRT